MDFPQRIADNEGPCIKMAKDFSNSLFTSMDGRLYYQNTLMLKEGDKPKRR
ncbi:MAG: hypothetical protein CM15mV28_1490 [Thaumasvirus sp.]|nr:MAG: hypothetical protein CM15mV28_1490 [Thaumasvirus sp.]